MNTISRFATVVGGITFAAALTTTAFAQNLLVNGDFETALAGNWNTFGNASRVVFTGSNGPAPHSGTGEAKLFGTFPGTSGFYQNFVATPGQAFNGSAFGQNWSSDAMQASNAGFLRVTFFNSGNTEIGGAGANSAVIDVNSTPNTWIPLSVTNVVAPTGTAYGRAFLLFTQPGTNGGSAWFDDVSVTSAVPEPLSMIGLASGLVILMARRRRKA